MLAMNGAAPAQDPCVTIASQAASLYGFAGAKVEAIKSDDNTLCDLWSKDRKSHITLIVEPPQAASGVAMRKMLATNTAKKETGMTVKEEPSLGASAFSFVKKEQLSFSGVGKGGVYTLNLNRDAGIVPSDEDRVRALAKQVMEGR
jgi:hypothetical protein